MTKQEVYDFLKNHNYNYNLIEHKPVFRVADHSEELNGFNTTKCLLVKDSSAQTYLVIMRGSIRLDLKKLATNINTKRISMVSYEDVETSVGVKPGSVSLFGLFNEQAKGIVPIIDGALYDQSVVGLHPNDNTATVLLSPQDVVAIANYISADSIVVEL